MLKLLPEWLKLTAGVAVGALLATYPAILVGWHEGRQQAATTALSASVDLLRKRNSIDDQISASDSSALCAAMQVSGDDQAECVRRLSAPAPLSGNVGVHSED